MNSPFQILGLTPAATPREILAAHRRLMISNHPDRCRMLECASCGGIALSKSFECSKCGSMVTSIEATSRELTDRRAAHFNAARDAVLTKRGQLTPLARELRRAYQRGAGATVQHTRHTFYQGAQQVTSIYARATNAAMQELLEQIINGEPLDAGEIARAGFREARQKGRHRR